MEASLDEEQVRESLNFVERALASVSSDDEYLAAMLHNQKIMTQALLRSQTSPGAGSSNNIPPGTAGLSLESISEDDVGDVLFKVEGRTVIGSLRAAAEVESEEVVRVGDEGNEVYPISGVGSGKLDFGAVASVAVSPNRFVYGDTEENVTIQPGESEAVLDLDVSGPIGLQSIGTNDETYSLYQYEIDGESMLDSPIKKPLGLYNDMFEFPQPIRVDSDLTVFVKRQEDAPGPAEYFSNVVLM